MPKLLSAAACVSLVMAPTASVEVPSSAQAHRGAPVFCVADLDEASKDANSTKPSFFSYLQHGTLDVFVNSNNNTDQLAIRWGEKERATSSMNDAGRGFELSELALYQDKLLTVDDCTDIVFELTGFADDAPLQAIPQNIVMEGNGASPKGQKHEWATVKDNELYLWSTGVVLTDSKTNKTDSAREWVAILNATDHVRHVDWTAHYEREPGYVTHEAVEWSSVHKKWFMIPCRVSPKAFDEKEDYHCGASKLIIASEDFEDIEIVSIGKEVTPKRGFSSFKFVPNTDDSFIVATKSLEIEDDQQNAFVTVFDIHCNILLDDVEIPGDAKYEGLAFVQQYVVYSQTQNQNHS